MDADQAAQKIALQNSPEFKQSVDANRVAREQFETAIIGDKKNSGVDIEKVINDSILGKRGIFSHVTFGMFDPTRGSFTESQKAEAKQTYLELALDHFDKYHDAGAAPAYAAQEMGRLYGVEGNRIMKYPPSKAYPEIMGNRDYIYDQAAEDVNKFTGLKIPKEDISLQPLSSGATAAAFRAGTPVPYQIFYVTHENG